MSSTGICAEIARSPNSAITRPSGTLTTASTTPSVSSCRTIRQRPAPSARRTASSLEADPANNEAYSELAAREDALAERLAADPFVQDNEAPSQRPFFRRPWTAGLTGIAASATSVSHSCAGEAALDGLDHVREEVERREAEARPVPYAVSGLLLLHRCDAIRSRQRREDH